MWNDETIIPGDFRPTLLKDFQQLRIAVCYGSEDIRPTLLKDFPTALNDSML